MKSLFNTKDDWFSSVKLLLDLGFLGAQKDYKNANISIPHKKPRKSKNKPNTFLTKNQKEENKSLSKSRVTVEHAIGGMKIFGCISQRIRNHLDILKDSFLLASAALWNFKILKII
jgi:hypothetical protein